MDRAPDRRGWRVVVSVARRTMPVLALIVVVTVAVLARRQAPWIPWGYLVAVIGLGAAIWILARWRPGPTRRVRVTGLLVAGTLLVALLPVPWMTAGLADPPGTAWRLDGRLHVDGDRIDPPGEWYWLTVGRPPLVAEVVSSWFGVGPTPVSMRSGTAASRPQMNEPAAVAVGMQAAGRPVALRLVVELSDPIVPGVPDRLVVATLNGIEPTDRAEWQRSVGSLTTTTGPHTITGLAGTTYEFSGTVLPYGRADLIDVPVDRIDAVIGGRLATTPIGRWFRGLALGRSHGLMVSLVTYSHVSGEDLARGRIVAGTGGIRGDGTVVRIGGVRSKAAAAARLGADVLLVPAEQIDELDGLDLGTTRVLPVADLQEAIAALRGPTVTSTDPSTDLGAVPARDLEDS